MYTVILFAAVALAVIVLLIFRDYKRIGRVCGDDFPFVFFGLFLAVTFGALVAATLGAALSKDDYRETKNWTITSVSDSSLTGGRFFLGSGRIEEKSVYYYYYPDKYGGISQGWVLAEKTSIMEDAEPDKAYIRKLKTNYNDSPWVIDTPTYRYEIHVPPGSVVRTFNFDLEK